MSEWFCGWQFASDEYGVVPSQSRREQGQPDWLPKKTNIESNSNFESNLVLKSENQDMETFSS